MADDGNFDERQCIDETPRCLSKEGFISVQNSTLFETWGLEYLERRFSWRECYKTETGDVRSCDGRSVIKITMCLAMMPSKTWEWCIQGYIGIHMYRNFHDILSPCQAVVSTIPTGLSLVRTCIPSVTILLTEALLLNPAYGWYRSSVAEEEINLNSAQPHVLDS